MQLVENAWGLFGASFGPVILLSLFWKRLTLSGAVAGIIAGAAVDLLWMAIPALSGTGLYELVPGFVGGAAAAILTTLFGKPPGHDVEALFDKSVAFSD
jgi:sodium/proline symporter